MRVLHTSDWHLGHSLHQFDRAWEHARFLDWLLDTLEAQAADVLLVAGDIFDSSNPPASAQALLNRFLIDARRRVPHLQIVLTAGNHDSPGRLESLTPFLGLFEATVIGQARCPGLGGVLVEGGMADGTENGRGADADQRGDPPSGSNAATDPQLERLLVPLRKRTGEVAAWCIAMPFLRPADVPRVDPAADAGKGASEGAGTCGGDGAGAGDAYAEGVAALYRHAFEAARARRLPGQAIIATGHCHLRGGQVSEESERRVVVGGAEALSARLFDQDIAYVALGHLHLAQRVGGDDTRRYSGSPLPLSFSEVNYPHQVVLVEFDGERVGAVRQLPVPRAVPLLRVPPRPAPLDEVLEALAALELPPTDAAWPAEAQWPYLQVRVRIDQPEPGLRAQIEQALAGKPVRLARIETTTLRAAGESGAAAVSIDELAALDPAGFFRRLYRHRFGDDAPEALLGAFNELLAADAGDDDRGRA